MTGRQKRHRRVCEAIELVLSRVADATPTAAPARRFHERATGWISTTEVARRVNEHVSDSYAYIRSKLHQLQRRGLVHQSPRGQLGYSWRWRP